MSFLPYSPSEVTGSLSALVRKDEEGGGNIDTRAATLGKYLEIRPELITEDVMGDGSFMLQPHDFAAAASHVLRVGKKIPPSVLAGLPQVRKLKELKRIVAETEVVFTTTDPPLQAFLEALTQGGERGKIFLFLVAACLTRLAQEPVRKSTSEEDHSPKPVTEILK